MNGINVNYTRNEVLTKQAQNAIARQNAIWSAKGEQAQGMGGCENQQQDSVAISSEAQMLLEQMHRMREDNEKSAEMADTQGKCMLIAMRIAAGDEVPQKDIKFLIKYNAGLYAKAMQMRIPKNEPEEYDTVLDEEDERELEKSEMGAMNVDLSEGMSVIS